MDLLHTLLSNLWSTLLIAVFFGGSIFVHELGHFLAARRRGMVVERFSIGFGPKIFSWHGKDGVEYRLSWLPLGGYVLLPQLADMRGIEGESKADLSGVPPPGYATKMIVSVAGAVCNVIFAFALACILWGVGLPSSSDQTTTRIGYVFPQITLSDGRPVTSPAAEAGLRVGDTIRAIDGHRVEDWQDVVQYLLTGADHSADGRREARLSIERDGRLMDVIVHPRIAGDDSNRKVGIAAACELIAQDVDPAGVGAAAGFKSGDRILSLDGTRVLSPQTYFDCLTRDPARPVAARVLRGDATIGLTIPSRAKLKDASDLGLVLTTDTTLVHTNPFAQIADHVSRTYNTFLSLLNPRSDIGLSKLSGPVGIVHIFRMASQADIRFVLWVTILVNVNLALFNLLPIPVLDGGHMLFATIARLRRRAIPAQFIASTQGVFMVLLLTMVLYVTYFDSRRWIRADRAEQADSQAVAAPSSPAPAK